MCGQASSASLCLPPKPPHPPAAKCARAAVPGLGRAARYSDDVRRQAREVHAACGRRRLGATRLCALLQVHAVAKEDEEAGGVAEKEEEEEGEVVGEVEYKIRDEDERTKLEAEEEGCIHEGRSGRVYSWSIQPGRGTGSKGIDGTPRCAIF
eukprot:364275-Chlamydomonas_euryale.AAC.1